MTEQTGGRLDLVFKAGTTWERTVEWIDEAGTFVDTAGYAATLQIRANIDDDLPALEISTDNGMITVGKVNEGTADQYNLKWSVPPAMTEAVEDFGKGVYALKVTDNTGRDTRLLEGICRYSPDAARS